jgi:hypothetical protein
VAHLSNRQSKSIFLGAFKKNLNIKNHRAPIRLSTHHYRIKISPLLLPLQIQIHFLSTKSSSPPPLQIHILSSSQAATAVFSGGSGGSYDGGDNDDRDRGDGRWVAAADMTATAMMTTATVAAAMTTPPLPAARCVAGGYDIDVCLLNAC